MNAKANILLLSAFAAALAGAETIVPWPDSWNCGITINGVNAGREIYGVVWLDRRSFSTVAAGPSRRPREACPQTAACNASACRRPSGQ